MNDAKKQSAKKLEIMLKVTVEEISEEIGKGTANIYATYRSKNLPFYRVILFGIRVLKSSLTTKEFLRMLEDAEALKESK